MQWWLAPGTWPRNDRLAAMHDPSHFTIMTGSRRDCYADEHVDVPCFYNTFPIPTIPPPRYPLPIPIPAPDPAGTFRTPLSLPLLAACCLILTPLLLPALLRCSFSPVAPLLIALDSLPCFTRSPAPPPSCVLRTSRAHSARYTG